MVTIPGEEQYNRISLKEIIMGAFLSRFMAELIDDFYSQLQDYDLITAMKTVSLLDRTDSFVKSTGLYIKQR